MARRLAPALALCLLFVCALAAGVLPARAAWDTDHIEELLPIGPTPAEQKLLDERAAQGPDRDAVSDPPPLAPLRGCAEWEPATGVLIRYPLGLPYNLLRDFDDQVTLHVIVSSSNQAAAISNFTANGVDMAKVQWLVRNSDSIWTRDYGPEYVFNGNGDVAIIDHEYNRPRPNDDLIPIYFAEQQGIPCHTHDMYFTGGNYMTDGAHISSSSDLIYDEALTYNGMSPAQVDQLMADYYGVDTYYVLDDIANYGIHHIDTWAKFLDEETVLVKEVWAAHDTYAALNQRAALLASLPSSTGRNYDVHRVYCYSVSSGPASYTNSLVLNNHIYIPLFGNSTYDNAAIAAYQAAAPGYIVTGYTYSGWLTDDALHCRAKGAYDVGMLRVAHIPIVDEQTGLVTVLAQIHAHSDAAIAAAELNYRQSGGAWQVAAMTHGSGDDWSAVIPDPAADGLTEYYLHVADASGRTAGMPRTEPAAVYSFTQLKADVTAADGLTPANPVALHANYPNPFNPSTTFSFTLLFEDRVELAVYDAQGKRVRTLIDGRGAGRRHARHLGRPRRGRRGAAQRRVLLPAAGGGVGLRAAGDARQVATQDTKALPSNSASQEFSRRAFVSPAAPPRARRGRP